MISTEIFVPVVTKDPAEHSANIPLVDSTGGHAMIGVVLPGEGAGIAFHRTLL